MRLDCVNQGVDLAGRKETIELIVRFKIIVHERAIRVIRRKNNDRWGECAATLKVINCRRDLIGHLLRTTHPPVSQVRDIGRHSLYVCCRKVDQGLLLVGHALILLLIIHGVDPPVQGDRILRGCGNDHRCPVRVLLVGNCGRGLGSMVGLVSCCAHQASCRH